METKKSAEPRFITELDITPRQHQKLLAQLAQNPAFEQAFWGGKYTSPECLARAWRIPMRRVWPVLALVVPLYLYTKLEGAAVLNAATVGQAVVVSLIILCMVGLLCMLALFVVQKKMGRTAYWLNMVFAVFQKTLKNKRSHSIQCRFLFFEKEVLIEKCVDSQYIQDFSAPIPHKHIAYILPYSKLCVFQQAQLLSVGDFTVLPLFASFPLFWNTGKGNAEQEQLVQFLQEKLFSRHFRLHGRGHFQAANLIPSFAFSKRRTSGRLCKGCCQKQNWSVPNNAIFSKQFMGHIQFDGFLGDLHGPRRVLDRARCI